MSDLEYAEVAHFAQTWGLGILLVCSTAAILYAFWPGNKSTFERAARAPLEGDEQ